MYKVIVEFIDLQDNNYIYNVGDVFPHDGKSVSNRRLEMLASDKNRRKTPLIQKIKDDVKPTANREVEFMNPPVESDAKDNMVEEVKKTRRSRKK